MRVSSVVNMVLTTSRGTGPSFSLMIFMTLFHAFSFRAASKKSCPFQVMLTGIACGSESPCTVLSATFM